MTYTQNEIAVLKALRDAEEGDGQVYLDNVKRNGLSRKAFNGVLSSLQSKGVIKCDDGFFVYLQDSTETEVLDDGSW